MRDRSRLFSARCQVIRRVALAFTGLYVVILCAFAAIKAGTPFFQAQAWAEVVYGPAITIGCSFLLFLAAIWIETRQQSSGPR
jgi:hypothetical protein